MAVAPVAWPKARSSVGATRHGQIGCLSGRLA